MVGDSYQAVIFDLFITDVRIENQHFGFEGPEPGRDFLGDLAVGDQTYRQLLQGVHLLRGDRQFPFPGPDDIPSRDDFPR